MKGTEFAPLLLTLVSNVQPDLNGLKTMPYDYYCPTLQNKLEARTYKNCEVYFASKKSLEAHIKILHPKIRKEIILEKKIRHVRY